MTSKLHPKDPWDVFEKELDRPSSDSFELEFEIKYVPAIEINIAIPLSLMIKLDPIISILKRRARSKYPLSKI